MPTITKLEKMERANQVLKMLGDGYFTYQIIDVIQKEWSIGPRAAKRYITYCYKFLKTEVNKKDRDSFVVEYETLIQKYERMGNSKMAYLYRVQRDKILGLVVEKRDLTSGGKSIEMPFFPNENI